MRVRAVVDDDTGRFPNRAHGCALLTLVLLQLLLQAVAVSMVGSGLDDRCLLERLVGPPRLNLLIVDGGDASLQEQEATLALTTSAVEEASDSSDGGQGDHSRKDDDDDLDFRVVHNDIVIASL